MSAPAGCPSCLPSGVPGEVPVDFRVGHRDNPYPYPLRIWRPCEGCRQDRYRAWRNHTLRKPAKGARTA